MRYLALATDYDATLAHHGRVDAATLEALARLAATGRKLIPVTGRELDDLQRVFPNWTDLTSSSRATWPTRGTARIRAAIERRYTLPEKAGGLQALQGSFSLAHRTGRPALRSVPPALYGGWDRRRCRDAFERRFTVQRMARDYRDASEGLRRRAWRLSS